MHHRKRATCAKGKLVSITLGCGKTNCCRACYAGQEAGACGRQGSLAAESMAHLPLYAMMHSAASHLINGGVPHAEVLQRPLPPYHVLGRRCNKKPTPQVKSTDRGYVAVTLEQHCWPGNT